METFVYVRTNNSMVVV